MRYFVGYAVRTRTILILSKRFGQKVAIADLGHSSVTNMDYWQAIELFLGGKAVDAPVSPAGEQLGDWWYVTATKSGFQFTKRSNWSTVNARTPNIRWHSTLLWPRTRTWRAPNSSFSRPLTRSTVDRSR